MSNYDHIPADPADNAHYEIGPTGRVRKIRKPVWHKGHYAYLESSGIESAPMPGIVSGPWGIGKWNKLTHLPSGLSMGDFPLRANAKRAADRLTALLSIDWTQAKPDLVAAHAQMITILKSEGGRVR